MNQAKSVMESYFRVMGVLLISLVVIGFTSLTLVRPGGIASIPVLLHFHGALFLGWFALYITQTRLVAAKNMALHQRLGKLSIVLAISMVVIAVFVMRGALDNPNFTIAGMTATASLMFPFSDIVNFSIAYTLALTFRRDRDTHRRFKLLTCLLMIDPAVARIVYVVGVAEPMIAVIEIALFVSLFVYDFRTRGRPHWASVVGLGLFIGAMVMKMVVAPGPGWAAFVAAVFG